ncbi:amino acid permease [Bacillaceae bacterium Marseille-Q3522]|nr:amino acid permease [Bacillaceae bacterium Marseille-Q3522]
MKNRVKTTIRLPQAIALYIGAVLGSGILIVPGLAAEIAGPASLINWGFLMILAIPLSMCMAYLSRDYSNAGGVSYFTKKAFGKLPGSLTGWLFLMSVPIGAPVAALTGAGYVSAAFGLSEDIRTFLACIILLLAIILNYVGMSLVGKVQVAIVSGILGILLLAFLGAVPNMNTEHFTPFIPHGTFSIMEAFTILFWCFVGWEAVSHLSEEFVHPEKDVMRATLISAVLIGLTYFITAIAVVGTNSYQQDSQAALAIVTGQAFGPIGAGLIGISSLLICLATTITYIGAASRLAGALSKDGNAPAWFRYTSEKYNTPLGGLAFLTFTFIIVISLFALDIFSLTTFIKMANASFLLTYMIGCASGVILYKKEKKKQTICVISFLATAFMLLFTGWSIMYPISIILMVTISKRFTSPITFFYKKRIEK